MSFLQENYSENLAARITNKGRKKIAQGDFNISYFQVGDSEFDYKFSEFNGIIPNNGQKVLMPFDKDSQVKYPYKVSASTLTGTTYGTPIESSEVVTIGNEMGAAGFISGRTIQCAWESIPLTGLTGAKTIVVASGAAYSNNEYITVLLTTLSSSGVITGDSLSIVYKVVSKLGNTLTLDRPTRYSLGYPSIPITIIHNYCDPAPVDAEDQQDPWILNTVWSNYPAGLDPTVDEKLSGYTSNVFVSTKEYLGYNSSSGQTSNTGTTITNSFGDAIIVPPEEQHSLSIVHYSKSYSGITDFDLIFKYDDYIDHSVDGSNYFEVYIPFLLYERNSGTTIGALFHMDVTDHYINSSASDTRINQMKFRYLLDENDIRVGKVFVDHKFFVFDDQEIVAALDYKSNRRYTLPIPRISLVPSGTKCDVDGNPNSPLLSGDTVFVSYLLRYSGATPYAYTGYTGLHCNHYSKIIGTTTTGDISVKFNSQDFRYMKGFPYSTTGYIADRFYILAQRVTTGSQPDPMGWKIMEFTSSISGHTVGNIINPAGLRATTFVISDADYDAASPYDLETYMSDFPNQPSTEPEFGDEQPFPGSVKVIRATDLEVMRYLINLPDGYFMTSQNPSYYAVSPAPPKRISEIALLNENKEVLVIAKASSPIERVGSQVLSVQIDI